MGGVPDLLGCPGQAFGGGQAKAGRSLWPTLPGAAGQPRGLSYTLQEAPVKPCWSPGLATGLSPAWPATGSGQDTPGNGRRKPGRG